MASLLVDALGLQKVPAKQWLDIEAELASINAPFIRNDVKVTYIAYKGKQYRTYAIWVYLSIILRLVKPSELTPQGYITKAVLEACETPEVKAIRLQHALGIDV